MTLPHLASLGALVCWMVVPEAGLWVSLPLLALRKQEEVLPPFSPADLQPLSGPSWQPPRTNTIGKHIISTVPPDHQLRCLQWRLPTES